MDKREIIEGNKLIAEFMGQTIITDGISQFNTDYKPLKSYHTLWDDLIPVVEKIASLGYRIVIEFDRNIELNDIYMQNLETYDYVNEDYKDREYAIESHIHLIWFYVVNFIRNYNKNE